MDRREGHLPRHFCAVNWAVFQNNGNAHLRQRGRRHACTIARMSASPVLEQVRSIANIDNGLRLSEIFNVLPGPRFLTGHARRTNGRSDGMLFFHDSPVAA